MIDHNWKRSEFSKWWLCVRSLIPRFGKNKCQGCGAQISERDLANSGLPAHNEGALRISLDLIQDQRTSAAA